MFNRELRHKFRLEQVSRQGFEDGLAGDRAAEIPLGRDAEEREVYGYAFERGKRTRLRLSRARS